MPSKLEDFLGSNFSSRDAWVCNDCFECYVNTTLFSGASGRMTRALKDQIYKMLVAEPPAFYTYAGR